jgi:hypothetical protein
METPENVSGIRAREGTKKLTGREVSAHSDGTDLGSVGSGKGLEDTPWDTTEHVSDHEHGEVLRKDEDED